MDGLIDMAAVRERVARFVPYGAGPIDDPDRPRCPGCGAERGARHEEGCDHEHCPHCGDQSFLCGNCFDAIAGEVLGEMLARDVVLIPRAELIVLRAKAGEG